MRFPDEYLKCVAFLGAKPPETDFTAKATVFLIGFEKEGVQRQFAITAKHAVDGIHNNNGQAAVRYNSPDGVNFWQIPPHHWFFHPDPTVDLALCPVVSLEFKEHALLPSIFPLTDSGLEALDVGIGEQVFFPGLFVHHQGVRQNIPILRCGTIAAMGTEKIESKGALRDGYLIEARSIGGFSGAPVFIDLGSLRKTKNSLKYMGPGSIALLGVIHGHFVIPPTDLTDGDRPLDAEKINAGIVIVTPVQKLQELIKDGIGELGKLVDFDWRVLEEFKSK